uniref:Uncharacterized protein n=1 Tax=Anguilla anguilla TaxID=7936 RepID=A0A0E9PV36_ANGAN
MKWTESRQKQASRLSC